MDRGDWCGWFAVGIILAIWMVPLGLWAIFPLFLPLVAESVVKVAHRRSERQRLLSDAEYQHWCLMRGEDRIGIFGTKYQPTPLEIP